jgi:hypothetical protein
MINSSGQSNTPQVRLIEIPDCPKMVKLDGCDPNNFSNEKILVPIDSAISALQQKKAVNPRKSFVGLCRRIVLTIEKYKIK